MTSLVYIQNSRTTRATECNPVSNKTKEQQTKIKTKNKKQRCWLVPAVLELHRSSCSVSMFFSAKLAQGWWLVPTIPALRRPRQGDCGGSLGYRVRFSWNKEINPPQSGPFSTMMSYFWVMKSRRESRRQKPLLAKGLSCACHVNTSSSLRFSLTGEGLKPRHYFRNASLFMVTQILKRVGKQNFADHLHPKITILLKGMAGYILGTLEFCVLTFDGACIFSIILKTYQVRRKTA